MLIVALGTTSLLSQKSPDDLPKVLASAVEEEIQKHARENPKIAATALVEFANQRLAAKGFDFSVDPCDMPSKPTTIKFPAEYEGEFFHVYETADLDGNALSFIARQPGDAPCGCWLTLPLKSITSKRMVLVSERSELALKPPAKFLFEEIGLADASLRKTSRTWIVPNGGPPDAISTDGTRLFFEIEDTPLFLEIGAGGALKFVLRTTPGIVKRFIDLKTFPKDRNNAYLGFRRFTSGKKTHTVKFSHVCT